MNYPDLKNARIRTDKEVEYKENPIVSGTKFLGKIFLENLWLPNE